MSVWNWIQLAVAIAAAVVGAFGKQMNKWLGFVMVLAVGILLIVMSAISQDFRFLPLGAWAIVSDILAVIGNATAEAQADDDTLGAAVKNLPGWAWVTIAVLLVAAIVVGLVAIPAPVRRA